MIEEEWPIPEPEKKFDWSLPMKEIQRTYGENPKQPIDITKKKIVPKVPWTLEIYQQKVIQVTNDIAEHNRKINANEKRINEYLEIKKQLINQISKKYAYRRLLLDNIKEHFPESLNKNNETQQSSQANQA